MEDRNKKIGLGVAALVVVLGLVTVLVNTQKVEDTSELLGSADEELTVEEIGPPPSLVIDPDIDLSGALTSDGNFYQFERNQDMPDEDDLDDSTSRETWTALVFEEEYNSIVEFLEENTDLTDQLTLAVVWDEDEQDWNVYPNEIFRSDYDIDTLDIFGEDFDGTLIFNTSRSYSYANHIEERVGDFEAERGWNYGPKPDFDELDGKAVVFWTGDVTGNAERLTSSGDLNDPIDEDFFDDLEDDEVYWFYVKGTVTDSCSDNQAYVCGVDGNTYLNSCVADEEDVDVDYTGRCKNDRTALRGRIEDDRLEPDGTLVLEFFLSASDNSPEDIDIDLDEIDLDDNDTGFAIYEIDGSRFNFVTAFESSDVTVNDDSVEIDLENNLDVGSYQLRIFDTFEREKFEEVELEFEVYEEEVPAEMADYDYDLANMTANTLELTLNGELDGRDFLASEFEDYFTLIDVASGNEVTFEDFDMDSNENVTITLADDVLDFDNINEGYSLEIERVVNDDEAWTLLADSFSLKGVQVYSEMDGQTVDGQEYDESLLAVMLLLKVDFITGDLVEDFDWINVTDGQGDLVRGTDYEIVESTTSGQYDMTFNVLGRAWSLPVDIDADFYYLGDGLYVPVQGIVQVEGRDVDDGGQMISTVFTYDQLEFENTLTNLDRYGNWNTITLIPNVDPIDLDEVDLDEIKDRFNIVSNYQGGEQVDIDQCNIEITSDKKIVIDCPKFFESYFEVEWTEYMNEVDGYALQAGSLSNYTEPA